MLAAAADPSSALCMCRIPLLAPTSWLGSHCPSTMPESGAGCHFSLEGKQSHSRRAGSHPLPCGALGAHLSSCSSLNAPNLFRLLFCCPWPPAEPSTTSEHNCSALLLLVREPAKQGECPMTTARWTMGYLYSHAPGLLDVCPPAAVPAAERACQRPHLPAPSTAKAQ